jgi:excinuclease ABC subunit C
MSKINQSLKVLTNTIKSASQGAGIYRMLGDNEQILYIGKAKNLKKRLTQYNNFKNLAYRIKHMVSQIQKIELINTDSEIEALILEANLIRTQKPKYNILLTDDKNFPYIYINMSHEYPAISITRNINQINKKNNQDLYFGPYIGSFDVKQLVNLLRKLFLIRNCSDHEFSNRNKPCLEYQIKKCSAPCTKYISPLQYKKSLQLATNVIMGKDTQLVSKNLLVEMNQYSKDLAYEKAIIARDKIKSLNMITAKQKIYNIKLENSDVIILLEENAKIIIALFRFKHGMNYGNQYFYPQPIGNKSEILSQFIKQFYLEQLNIDEIITNIELEDKNDLISYLTYKYNKKVNINFAQQGYRKLIVDFVLKNAQFQLKNHIVKRNQENNNFTLHRKLKTIFNLNKIPDKIEVFDNSHIFGSYAVGAMIVSSQNGLLKSQYRKFNIRNLLASGDDYAMLKEVLLRRYSKMLEIDPHNQKSSWPDLILIDGGKGQATITKQILSYLKLDIPFFCIAKGKERNKGKERFCNDKIDYFSITETDILYYLQNIRDEVHNFVINSHRKQRNKALTHSQLDDIPKIGLKRKKLLLSAFGSVAAIKVAALEDIAKLPNFSIKLAKEIKDLL